MKTREFTGFHMTTILVAFFAIVIAVNVIMAKAAVGTFGGTVVENSYVASQKYNLWLEQARAQKKLGWTIATKLDATRRVHVTFSGATDPQNFVATALVRHPLGQVPEQRMALLSDGNGGLVSPTPLPTGRWQVHLSVSKGGHTMRTVETLQ